MFNILKYVFTNLGIDLGTANTVVFAERKGYVVNEPSVIAFNKGNNVIAIGSEAKEMLLKGLDAIDVSLANLKQSFGEWFKADRAMRPWVYLEKLK